VVLAYAMGSGGLVWEESLVTNDGEEGGREGGRTPKGSESRGERSGNGARNHWLRLRELWAHRNAGT